MITRGLSVKKLLQAWGLAMSVVAGLATGDATRAVAQTLQILPPILPRLI
jgi:DNA-binding Xre family transcriptional regulator